MVIPTPQRIQPCCPSKVTELDGGSPPGGLVGESWDTNWGLYSSFGAKSTHRRLRFVGGTTATFAKFNADRIWLTSETAYRYPKRTIGTTSLSARLKADFSGVATWAIDNLVDRVFNLPVGDTIFDTLVDSVTDVEIKVRILKDSTNAVELEGDLIVFPPYSHSKSNAKEIKFVFDRSTAVVGWPAVIEKFATKFDVQYVDSYHKMTHKGRTVEFPTRKGRRD